MNPNVSQPHTTTLAAWYTAPTELESLTAGYTPINLKQIEAVALLNRTDVKFILSEAQLLQTLAALQNDYWLLEVQNRRLQRYRTLYFDTPDFALYHAHVNGRAERYKVRSRAYLDSQLAFLEVKRKTPKGRTIKERLATSNQAVELTPELCAWLATAYPGAAKTLQPQLWNTFTRLTLAGKHTLERITLDVELAFYADERLSVLDGLAIAEVKMERMERRSPFLTQMHTRHIQPHGFSKYCFGAALLYPQVKRNALKPRLRRIEKLTRGSLYHV